MNDQNRDALIQPAQFEPTAAPEEQRGIRFTRSQIVGSIVVLVVAWFLWFIFTAKSVRFDMKPADTAAKLQQLI